MFRKKSALSGTADGALWWLTADSVLSLGGSLLHSRHFVPLCCVALRLLRLAFLVQLQGQGVWEGVELAASLALLISTMILSGGIGGIGVPIDLLKNLDQTLGVLGQLVEVTQGQLIQIEQGSGLVLLRHPSRLLVLGRGCHHNRATLFIRVIVTAIASTDVCIVFLHLILLGRCAFLELTLSGKWHRSQRCRSFRGCQLRIMLLLICGMVLELHPVDRQAW